MKFGNIISVQIPSEMLYDLEKAIETHGEITNDWDENKRRYDELEKYARPVFNYRDNAFYPPMTKPITTHIPTVAINPRGASLISRYLDVHAKFEQALWGRP